MLQSSVVPAITGMGNAERAVYLPVGFSTYIYVYNIVPCVVLWATTYVTSNASDRPTTDRLHSLALPQPTYLGLRGIIMKALLGKCGVPLPQREGTLPGGECAGSSFGPG